MKQTARGQWVVFGRPVGEVARVLARRCLVVAVFALACPAAADAAPGSSDADLRARALSGPLQGVEQVVFAVRRSGPDGHWYANIGYYAQSDLDHPMLTVASMHNGKRVAYRRGGKLCRLNLRTGAVANLIDDLAGSVRDPAVHYDGHTILFSYRQGDAEHYHLYTIDADGTKLTQLTDGPYDDIEPCWLPDGGIMFVSTRCRRWVSCWVTQVATLHRCRGDGTDIRPISANLEHDNTPWVLPDGRVLYQRWEYVDRSQVDYHHLWTAHPDGTGQTVFYGNLRPGTVMIDAKPVPGSDLVVAIFSPGHGRRDHDGAVVLIDPKRGPDDPLAVRTIRRDAHFRDPWAFSTSAFLAAAGAEIVFLDGAGQTTSLYGLSAEQIAAGYQCHEPRPLVARPRERNLPPRVQPAQSTGRLILASVYEGRNMAGVGRGEIKKLLVLEPLPKPINYTGGMDPLTYGGSFNLERVVGTVPVEADGSAYLEVPALRPLFFVALDQDDLAVKRMQSFLTVQPGEVTGCVGCHEQRTRGYLAGHRLQALQRPPSRLEPIAGCPDVFDFPRNIQPILDALCADCHGYERTPRGGPRAGGVVLTGDHGPMFSHSYFTLIVRQLVSDGRDRPRSNYPPRALGSAASRLLQMLDGSHHGAVASAHQREMLRLWIDVGIPYPGTYAALGSGSIGGYAVNRQVHADFDWPTTQAGAAVIERRCASCHQGSKRLPLALADERGISFWRFDVDDPRLALSRHIVFNLTRPDESLLLLAPLAAAAGGYDRCRRAAGAEAVFAGTGDADYQALLAMVAAGADELERIGRFDLPGFRPPRAYVREMKRFGILPADRVGDAAIDPYATDRAYWRSLWYRPVRTAQE